MPIAELQTKRLVLREWRDSDREPFATMNADPRVMEHFPSKLTREASDALVEGIRTHFRTHGFGVWAVEHLASPTPTFIGYVGLAVPTFEAPFIPCVEIGWRLAPSFWGRGLATEGARAAVTYAFATLGLNEILAWTIPANKRSWQVMERLGMKRAPGFDHPRFPEGHPLRRHVRYRIRRASWPAKSPTPESTAFEVAQAFARALDDDDFERARPCLSPECVYDVRGRTLSGPNAILRSYADASRHARSLFDDVRYESIVEANGASIEFTDFLRRGAQEERHRSVQHLVFDDERRIRRILHEDVIERGR